MKRHHHASVAITAVAAAVLSVSLGTAARLSAAQPSQSQTTQQPPPVPPTQPPPPSQQPPTPVPPPPSTPPAPTPTPAQPPATQPTTATGDTAQTPASTATPTGGAAVLLDRISDLVDQALGEKPADKSSKKGTPGATGTSGVLKVDGTAAGSVKIERATLDEIRAEVEQLKIMLKDRQPEK